MCQYLRGSSCSSLVVAIPRVCDWSPGGFWVVVVVVALAVVVSVVDVFFLTVWGSARTSFSEKYTPQSRSLL